MKNSIKITLTVCMLLLGMAACNDVEQVNLKSRSIGINDDGSLLSSASPQKTDYLTLAEIEKTLIPYGVEKIHLPDGYVPILDNYIEIRSYANPETPNYYYVYVVDEDAYVTDGGPSPFNSTWHSSENETGACYNPGSDCTFGGHYPDGETIIICAPDA
jgi:hypothetical protein